MMRIPLLLLAATNFVIASNSPNNNVSIENKKNTTPKDPPSSSSVGEQMSENSVIDDKESNHSIIITDVIRDTKEDDFQVFSDYYFNLKDEDKCPLNWHYYDKESCCYRLVMYPKHTRSEARKFCQDYGADLFEGHERGAVHFVIDRVRKMGRGGTWHIDLNNSFSHTGIKSSDGSDSAHFICEGQPASLRHLIIEDEKRSFTYGLDNYDPEKIPRGPFFYTFEGPEDMLYQNNINNEDMNIHLNCHTGGYPALIYKWFKVDSRAKTVIDISTVEDSRYEVNEGKLTIYFPDIDDNNSTMYYCTASNKFGTIRSDFMKVFVAGSEKFLKISDDGVGIQNSGKVIYCETSLNQFNMLDTVWRHDKYNIMPPSGDSSVYGTQRNEHMVDEDSRVFVSYDGGLYFSALDSIKDPGSYKCQIWGKHHKESTELDLVVLPSPPPSPELPLSSDINITLEFPNHFPKVFPDKPLIDRKVRLECVVFGYPVPSYKWIRHNSDLPKSAILSSFNRVLTISNVGLDDEGEYVCEADNGQERKSKGVFLKLQAEPYFTTPLPNKHADIGSDILWKCEAFGIPEVTYFWLKNGVELSMETLVTEDEGRYLIQDNILTIKNLDPDRDPGMYQCAAKNQLQTQYSTGELRVLFLKPSFKNNSLPLETYGLNGQKVTLNCNPAAAPKPKFTWKKDGVVIGVGDKKIITENEKLEILSFSKDDEGIYTCKAENHYGADETSSRLILLPTPRFIQKPPSQFIAQVNQNFTLNCKAEVDKNLPITYFWSHNSNDILDSMGNGGYSFYLNVYGQAKMHIEDGSITIIKASYKVEGDYKCTAKTSIGQMSVHTQVLVAGPPDPPENFKIVDIQRSLVTLEWTDGNPHGYPITGYIITYSNDYNKTKLALNISVTDVINTDNHNRHRATLKINTKPWYKYEFRIEAFNTLGITTVYSFFGKLPPYATATAPPDKPYEKPRHVSGGGKEIGKLTISWEPLPINFTNGPGIHYQILWRRSGSGDEYQSLLLKEQRNIGTYTVNVSSNNFYTPYDVKVQAWNDLGAGPESEPVTLYSGEQKPLVAPRRVVAIPWSSSSIKVIWDKVDESLDKMRGKLIGYKLKYWEDVRGEYNNDMYYFSESTLNSAVIGGLRPYNGYYVKVMAVNSAGTGPESEPSPMRRTFAKGPQTAPACIDVRVLNSTTVQVTWCEVHQDYWKLSTEDQDLREEWLLGYKVKIHKIYEDIIEEIKVTVEEKLERNLTILSFDTESETYFVEVLAYSNGGDGLATRSKWFRMKVEDRTEIPTEPPTTTPPPEQLPKCSLGQSDLEIIQNSIDELKRDLKSDSDLTRRYMMLRTTR